MPTKHAMCYTVEYRAWLSMKVRCYDKRNIRWPRYGGRGISVCQKWLHSFEAFYEDMGPKPSRSHSLDRVDNDLSYSPENCRWATPTEQSQNRKLQANNKTGYRGVSLLSRTGRYKAEISIQHRSKHLGYFITAEDAALAYNRAAIGLYGTNAKLNEILN